MKVKQSPVTLQAYIRDGQEAALAQLLSSLGNPAPAGGFFPFAQFEELHFGRWAVLPGTMLRGRRIRASLLYAANVDGRAPNHLQNLVDKAPDALDQIFAHCDGYPEASARTPEARLAYLRRHVVSTPAFYVGAPGRSVGQIRQEAHLRQAVAGYVDQHQGISSSPVVVIDTLRKWLATDTQWEWAATPFHMPRIRWAWLILLGLCLLVLLPFIALLLVLLHFIYERRMEPLGLDINQLDPAHLQPLMAQEDYVYQNQITQVFNTKPGLYRLALPLFLWITNQLAWILFVKGSLLGTPTIHFARWVIIDGGRRFVFLSNFDGSFDEYLGDFIDNGGWGLNAIYGNSEGYPRTLFLLGKGSYQIGQFLGWGRYYQVPTQAWYSAYPQLGLPQINYHSQLRAGLFDRRTVATRQLDALLRLI